MDASEECNYRIRVAVENRRLAIWRNAGRCALPIHTHGPQKKHPCLPTWKQYQSRLPLDVEILLWTMKNADPAFGCVCGRISGGLEILDFDFEAKLIFPKWYRLVEPIAKHLVVNQTRSGGFQVWYLCDVISGSKKLALPALPETKARIETRGEGGFAVAPPSTIEGGSYKQLSGPQLPIIPRIDSDDRSLLWSAAEQFNLGDNYRVKDQKRRQVEAERASRPLKTVSSDGHLEPWDDFNERQDAKEMLAALGFKHCRGKFWTRPNKVAADGHSVAINTGPDGRDFIYVFSSSIAGVDPNQAYSKFDFWKALQFNGDGKRATNEARKLGFGSNNGEYENMEFVWQ